MTETIQLPVMALKPAIVGLSKVISKRATLPVLGAVKITRRASGELSFQGTDLDALAIYTTETTKGGKDSTILIPFDELATIVKGCPKGVFIQLTVEDGKARLRYPVGGAWLEKPIATFEESEWPVIPQIKSNLARLPDGFQSDLAAALDCVSDHKPNLNGSWLDVEDKKAHYVVASDGHQLFSANSFHFDLKESLLIPNHKFLHWAGFLDDGDWSLAAGELNKEGNGWTQIQSAYWTFIVKQTKSQCPNWKQVIPAETKTHVTFSDEAVAFLSDVLPKLPGASQYNHGVTFDFSPRGTFVIGNEGAQSARVEVNGVKISGNKNTFTANRILVLKALKLGLKDLSLVDGLTPIVFSDARRKLVIAPLRPDSAPTPTTTSAPAPVQPPAESTSAEPSTETDNTQPEGETVKTINRITQSENTTTSDGAGETEQQQGNSSPLKQAMQKVDQIKDSLRAVQTDLNDLLKLLGHANRDHRSTEKEVEEVRDALQQLQRIKI